MRRLASWLRAVLRRNALEREMHEEMAEHLERATELLQNVSSTEELFSAVEAWRP